MRAAALIGVVVLGIGAGLLLGSLNPPTQALAGFEQRPLGRPLPEFELQGTDGPFTRASLRGHWTLLTFGYSRCPDVCPVTLATLDALRRRLAQAGLDFEVRLVSVDPGHDSLPVLTEYVHYFHCQGARVPFSEVRRLTDALGATFSHGGNGGSVRHSAGAFVIDPEARLAARIRPPLAVPSLAKALTRLRAGCTARSDRAIVGACSGVASSHE